MLPGLFQIYTDLLVCDYFLVYEEFEDTKGVIGIRKLKKDRQHNGQKKKGKRTNNDPHNMTHKTKNRVTRTPLKPVVNSGALEWLAVSAPPVALVVLL